MPIEYKIFFSKGAPLASPAKKVNHALLSVNLVWGFDFWPKREWNCVFKVYQNAKFTFLLGKGALPPSNRRQTVFNHVFLSKFVWVLSNILPKGMKLHILTPIKYKSTQKEIVLAKLKQYYGLKIVHLLQDNEITESSQKALKDAQTWELPGPHPWLLVLRAWWSPLYHLAQAPHPLATPL